jgi:hypothetical protein
VAAIPEPSRCGHDVECVIGEMKHAGNPAIHRRMADGRQADEKCTRRQQRSDVAGSPSRGRQRERQDRSQHQRQRGLGLPDLAEVRGKDDREKRFAV